MEEDGETVVRLYPGFWSLKEAGRKDGWDLGLPFYAILMGLPF